MNSKVVLRACSKVTMVKHGWKRKSNAAILGADIAPRNLEGTRSQPVVTVTLLAAIPPLARRSEAYIFTVTAEFDGGDAEIRTSNMASTTLLINHVRCCCHI